MNPNHNPISVAARRCNFQCKQPFNPIYTSIRRCDGKCSITNAPYCNNKCSGKSELVADACCGDTKIAIGAAAPFAGLIFLGHADTNGSA